MMKCRDIKFELPLFVDDVITADERRVVSLHLAGCPLCRQELSEIRAIRSALSRFGRPAMPDSLLQSIRSNVAYALCLRDAPSFRLIEKPRWIDAWLAPSAAATLATIVFGFLLIFSIFRPGFSANAFETGRTLATSAPKADISRSQVHYGRPTWALASQTPSVNPRGALIALSESMGRTGMKDDEVVVVADVFSDGLARIAQVVEPSRDRQAIAELQKAFEADPAFAPFVPTNLNNSSNSLRVVLKIQSVSVNTHLRSRKN